MKKALVRINVECPDCGYDKTLKVTGEKAVFPAAKLDCVCGEVLQIPLVLANFKPGEAPPEPEKPE